MTARNETSVSVSRRRSVPPHEIVMLDKSFPLSTISRFPSVKSMSRDSMSGATVKLSTKDDQGTPAEAVSGFNSLLSEGASAIIGATLSSCTSAITSLADDEGIVLVTPSSTADYL